MLFPKIIILIYDILNKAMITVRRCPNTSSCDQDLSRAYASKSIELCLRDLMVKEQRFENGQKFKVLAILVFKRSSVGRLGVASENYALFFATENL